MTLQDISNIRRFIGVVEGITISMPEQTQSLIYDYIEVVDAILDREEKGGAEEWIYQQNVIVVFVSLYANTKITIFSLPAKKRQRKALKIHTFLPTVEIIKKNR